MDTPVADIKAFLEHDGNRRTKQLELAILFAQGMLRELHASVGEWETTLYALQETKRREFSFNSN